MANRFLKPLILAAALFSLAASAQPTLKPCKKGGFETGQYRNVFAEMGYPQAEINARLEQVYKDVFCGPNKIINIQEGMGDSNWAIQRMIK